MKIKPKQYAQSLLEALKDASQAEAKVAIANFIALIHKNNHLSQINRILEYFEKIWNREKGIVPVEIGSARKLDEATIKDIKDHVKGLSGAHSIEIRERIDTGLLGGIVVKYGDKIIDNSLKARVQDFKHVITK